ncbi:MAG TPA: VOC family protein [Candidatus Dormibacteraeota bacterium]|nr:VOC family protein [Candidatus Dormibacteraeota bacterium]
MRISSLDHLVLTVRSVEAAVDFYTSVLGMNVRSSPAPDGRSRMALRFGSQMINLHPAGAEFEPKARRPTPGGGDVCLLTDDPLDDWLQHLEEAGVPIIEGPVPRRGALGPMMSLYFRDPDGNLLEVSRYGEG